MAVADRLEQEAFDESERNRNFSNLMQFGGVGG
jgi:hypothetical protein